MHCYYCIESCPGKALI
ncbi:MAG: hypothetical protein JW864_12955 [Spirochaetes bacterium]|nr:hypothetical protein [Spirochaetota bacterium]